MTYCAVFLINSRDQHSIKYLNYKIKQSLPASGIASKADIALIADLLSSSCFSYSCFTAFAFTFVVHVARNGSTNLSNPTTINC